MHRFLTTTREQTKKKNQNDVDIIPRAKDNNRIYRNTMPNSTEYQTKRAQTEVYIFICDADAHAKAHTSPNTYGYKFIFQRKKKSAKFYRNSTTLLILLKIIGICFSN